jgi:hypothetical protein
MGGYYERAAKRTQVAASQTNAQIEGGESITIYGIVITGNGGAGQATFEEGASAGDFSSTTEVLDLQAASGESEEIHTTWLADKGLRVTTAATTKVTVFHSQRGA